MNMHCIRLDMRPTEEDYYTQSKFIQSSNRILRITQTLPFAFMQHIAYHHLHHQPRL